MIGQELPACIIMYQLFNHKVDLKLDNWSEKTFPQWNMCTCTLLVKLMHERFDQHACI
jgi:hypothetical protein